MGKARLKQYLDSKAAPAVPARRHFSYLSAAGDRIADWFILGDEPLEGKHWLARCERCGLHTVVDIHAVRHGRSKCCRRCSARQVGATIITTHGQSSTKLYRTWCAMKQRCYNPRQKKSYPHYGGQGVRVCDAWLHSFERFRHDMGEPPTPLHTIDRIDPRGDYEPRNTRWASQHEQMTNTRRARRLRWQG